MGLLIRPVRLEDMPAVVELTRAAGLAAAAQNIERYTAWGLGRYYAAELDGRLLGTAGAVLHDGASFVGAMAVAPEHRSKGLGRALLERVLDEVSASPTALLEATPLGFPLYRKLGFIAEHETLVLERPAPGAPIEPAVSARDESALDESALDESALDVSALVAFDAPRFGVPRSGLLRGYARELARRAVVLPGGAFGFALDGRVGPIVADDPSDAARILDALLRLPHAGPVTLQLPAVNEPAARLALSRGFVETRRMHRMRRGPAIPARPSSIFALATAGVG